MQNVKIAVNWVTQGHRQCRHSLDHIRRPNWLQWKLYASIFYRFWVIASYLNSPILTYPTCIWCLYWGDPRLHFAEIFGARKIESLGYCGALYAWSCISAFSHFSRTPTCDRRTDTRCQLKPALASIVRVKITTQICMILKNIPRAWLQLLQGSTRFALSCEASARAAVAAELFWLFHPLHLHPSD